MFVWGFLLGFFLAFIVNLFWVRQLRATSDFGQVIGKETSSTNHRDMVIDLEIEVEHLQEQIQRMEDHLSFGGRDNSMAMNVVSPTPLVKPGLSPVRDLGREEFFPGNSNKKIQKQGEVLGLWEQGKQVSEIARDTGLGKGEVELILSLRNKLHRTALNDGVKEEEKDRLLG